MLAPAALLARRYVAANHRGHAAAVRPAQLRALAALGVAAGGRGAVLLRPGAPRAARRRRGGCARAARRRSRPGAATRRCSAGRCSTCSRARRASARVRRARLRPAPRRAEGRAAARVRRPRAAPHGGGLALAPGPARRAAGRGRAGCGATGRDRSVFAPRYRAMSVGVLMSVTIVAFQALGVGTVMPAVARDLRRARALRLGVQRVHARERLGTVAAGQRRRPRGPVRAVPRARSATFAAGSVLGARSPARGRCCSPAARCEGLGAGALGVVTYASASRAYPPEMYGRMLALMSSAWVLPSLAGPAVAGLRRRPRELALGVRAAAAVPAGRGRR